MADMAKEIVDTNGYSNVITVLKGKVEEIELPIAKVDTITSEWMGYFMLFENMSNTVLYARDKWLRFQSLKLVNVIDAWAWLLWVQCPSFCELVISWQTLGDGLMTLCWINSAFSQIIHGISAFQYAQIIQKLRFPAKFKVRDETYTAFENIYPVLTEFRKNQQCCWVLNKGIYEM
ncbi:putative protein arginine N-methyltransferase 1 [Morella rubra]|uniref:Uncharacterized protein n=1 Tax=Morella rubra TaxID=262757 RepID=A0A6A1WFB2_9ROSI|nr:putative protein arginine N-methyltransferase 1 [Morella rubra]